MTTSWVTINKWTLAIIVYPIYRYCKWFLTAIVYPHHLAVQGWSMKKWLLVGKRLGYRVFTHTNTSTYMHCSGFQTHTHTCICTYTQTRTHSSGIQNQLSGQTFVSFRQLWTNLTTFCWPGQKRTQLCIVKMLGQLEQHFIQAKSCTMTHRGDMNWVHHK